MSFPVKFRAFNKSSRHLILLLLLRKAMNQRFQGSSFVLSSWSILSGIFCDLPCVLVLLMKFLQAGMPFSPFFNWLNPHFPSGLILGIIPSWKLFLDSQVGLSTPLPASHCTPYLYLILQLQISEIICFECLSLPACHQNLMSSWVGPVFIQPFHLQIW